MELNHVYTTAKRCRVCEKLRTQFDRSNIIGLPMPINPAEIEFQEGMAAVSSLYFPMSELQLVAPPLRPTILLRVTARQNSGHESRNNPKYKIADNPGWVEIDPSSNMLRLTGKQKELASEEVKISARDKSRNTVHMKVNVTILSSMDVKKLCEENPQALCFWPRVQYQVYENSIPTLLGPLGPSYLQDLCPEYIISYQLISMDDFVQILNGSLWSKANLDRDTTQKTRSENVTGEINLSGPKVQAQIQCSVKRENDVSTYNKTVNVTVLDVNDNTPRPTIEGPQTLYLDNQGFIPKDYVLERLIFIDNDTKEVNVHRVSILEDEMKLWRINCNEVSHINITGFNDSVSTCTLRANYSMQFDPKKTYRLVVQMNDTSMVQGDKPSHDLQISSLLIETS
ncbi:uncharacterized protein [Anabrus simplex]|uniref:uncharacterized protein n=1 Tax=Anabrus simplex TaxID=316456 RepID=UPI0035A31A12